MTRRLVAAPLAALSVSAAVAWAEPQPLTPVVEALPSSGAAPLTVLLSGTESTGKWGGLGEIESWGWDLTYDGGDFDPEPSYLHNATVAYTFDRPGTHTVRLRITDVPNDGVPREAYADVTIEVTPGPAEPPEPPAYPPGAWGAGIQAVWADADDLAAAEGFVQPVDQAFMQWADVEPSAHGVYDWSRLDAALAVDYERRIIETFLETFRPLDVGVTLRGISSHLPVVEQNALYDQGDAAAWLLITNATYGKWDGGLQHTREFLVMRSFGARGFEETWSDSAARIAERNPELSTAQDIYGVVLRALEIG